MISSIRKLTTKPVWWWERTRKYRIRHMFPFLPTLEAKKGAKRFVVLSTPDTVPDALWAAWSWFRYLGEIGFELHLAVDGEIPRTSIVAANRLFPGVQIYRADSLCSYVCDREPNLRTFLYNHPTGRKFALMLALSDQGPVVFSDYDVLAFRTPEELLSSVRENIPCYFLEEVDGTRDPLIAAQAQSLGLGYLARFNCGFLFIPKGALSMNLAAQILATWRPPGDSWFAEQTVLSVMFRSIHAEALPPDRYVISSRRQFYWEPDVDYRAIVARHFTGTVRHVMYKRGLPELLKQSKRYSKEQVSA